MQAYILKATHEPLEMEERPALIAAAGEVVVALQAAALNRRDYWITQGLYPGIEPPVVLGSDGAGIVTAVGDGVDPGRVGAEVIINPGLDWGDNQAVQGFNFSILGLPTDGTFAGEVVVPASQLHQRPAHLSWQEAAALPLAGVTAYRAVFSQGGLASGETVLVTGAGGGVATFAIQFALAAGADVWCTSSSQAKIDKAVAAGARGGFLYTDEDWVMQYREAAQSPDLIIDSAAGAGYPALVGLAAPGGRIVNYGATAGPPKKIDMFKVFWNQLTLQGSTMGSPEDFAAMLAFVAEHEVRPIIDSVLPLDAVNTALEQMASSPQFGKLVLEIG
jgi:NADPH:quinone reductase-like Zn-dependent oxidoreductase